jgi:hypothetical protein
MSDVKLDRIDLLNIISAAKLLYSNKSFPLHLPTVGNKIMQVPEAELANLCVIEATIMVLNQKKLLNEVPKFDYKDDKFQEEY